MSNNIAKRVIDLKSNMDRFIDAVYAADNCGADI